MLSLVTRRDRHKGSGRDAHRTILSRVELEKMLQAMQQNLPSGKSPRCVNEDTARDHSRPSPFQPVICPWGSGFTWLCLVLEGENEIKGQARTLESHHQKRRLTHALSRGIL